MTGVPDQIAAWRAQANPSTVPSGVLLWFGDTALPDGCSASQPPLPAIAWTALTTRLYGAQVAKVLPPPPSPAVAAQPGEAVPLAIASVRFQRPTRSVTAAVMNAAANGTEASLPTDLAALLEHAETTVAALLLAPQWLRDTPVHRGRQVSITLPAELLITNDGDTITDVEVNGGGGWVPLPVGGSVSMQVPPGITVFVVAVRCTTPRGVRHATCTLPVSDTPVPQAPTETVALEAPNGKRGQLFVMKSGAHDGYRRPILIAEGWPGGASAASLTEAVSQHGLLDRLQALGHDVVMLQFAAGTDSMADNAAVVVEGIHHLNTNTADHLVVGGMSMGGIVARCALLQMEHEGVDHRTAVYLSLDSPHGRGAYTTLAGQWFVNHFAGLSPAYAVLEGGINSTSNKQFVMLMEVNGQAVEAPERKEFLEHLAALGNYPSKPTKLAVACGSGNGSDGAGTDAPVMRWQTPGLVDITMHASPAGGGVATVAQGSIVGMPPAPPLVVSGHTCWETAPGATNIENVWVTGVVSSFGCTIDARLGLSTSVPTVSSLDLATSVSPNDRVPPPSAGLSPFDDYITSATDQRHLCFTPEVVDWLVDRIQRHQPAQGGPS